LVYAALLPFTTMYYVGESSKGLEERGTTHLRKSLSATGRQRFNAIMASLGAHRLVWLPLYCWEEGPTTPPPSHYERLLVEGEFIWLWDPFLNEKGKQGLKETNELSYYGMSMILGRKRRTRQLLKFRRRSTAKVYVIKDKATNEAETKEQGRRATRRRNLLFPLLIRLSRRPLKRQHGFDELGAVKKLRALEARDLKHLLDLAEHALDGTSRSIFMGNFKMILRNGTKICTLRFQVKSPIFATKGFERAVLRQLRGWCADWVEKHVVIMLQVRLVASSSRSMLGTLDTTPAWSGMRRELAS